MSVYIKGMEMPGNCCECAFCRAAIWKGKEYPCVCLARDIVVKPSETDMRDGLCPLLPVPDHGRLVDADDVIEESRCGYYWWETEQQVPKILNEVRTIIPAERSEDD